MHVHVHVHETPERVLRTLYTTSGQWYLQQLHFLQLAWIEFVSMSMNQVESTYMYMYTYTYMYRKEGGREGREDEEKKGEWKMV